MSCEIVTKLSESFNQKAADVATVLAKYNAQLNHTVSDYYNVSGVQSKDADAFIREFSTLKGVEAAYKKPAAECP